MRVVTATAADRPTVEAFLERFHTRRVARRRELVDATEHPALLALLGDELVGVATYIVTNRECELLTLHAQNPRSGTGSTLLSALVEVARQAGCDRLRVVTTNDNVDALRFYQRRGFRLAELRAGAVAESRQSLKPEIPLTGAYDIDLRDEIELEMHVGSAPPV
jgi:N-acetylglutamate synthase-like GNAT family acetyltransferase